MDQEFVPQFSSGLELANTIVTSDLLQHSWKAIMELRGRTSRNGSTPGPRFDYYYERPKCKIIAFDCIQGGEGGDLVSFSSLKDKFPVFEFLCSKQNPDFSINSVAITLFSNYHDVFEQEISRMNSETQLIITGHALGGSIASLFTLFLIGLRDLSETNRPLCITFGSPLIGDERLQKAISGFKTWNSCFLHVVSNNDPLPRVFLNRSSPVDGGHVSDTSDYHPFGTFFLCSKLGCVCYEDPKSILELLKATKSQIPHHGHDPVSRLFDYENIVDSLKDQANCKATTNLVTENTMSLRGSFITQLEAIGVVNGQALQAQQQRNDVCNELTTILIDGETDLVIEKTKVFDPTKTLNDVKINMAKLEWYKKMCKSLDIGYYDSYKNQRTKTDITVAEFKKILSDYWKEMVEEVERKPQKEGASFRTRWLLAGTNYRLMVEPLDIAEHYRKGLDNYRSQRSHHYKKLEEWLEKSLDAKKKTVSKKENPSVILTEDSCFWADVEEAILACRVLKEDSSVEDRAKLEDVENLVVRLMKNYDVSPEIFLPNSSFMEWWKEYDEIKGKGHDTVFTRIMRKEQYDDYTKGKLEIL